MLKEKLSTKGQALFVKYFEICFSKIGFLKNWYLVKFVAVKSGTVYLCFQNSITTPEKIGK